MSRDDVRVILSATAFALAGIAADGLSTLFALSAGGIEGNPLMRDFFGRMIWQNFFIVRGVFFAAMAGGAAALWGQTKNRLLAALPMALAGAGDFHVAAQNVLVALKMKGWF